VSSLFWIDLRWTRMSGSGKRTWGIRGGTRKVPGQLQDLARVFYGEFFCIRNTLSRESILTRIESMVNPFEPCQDISQKSSRQISTQSHVIPSRYTYYKTIR
jgi:hypothetical protein